MILQTGYIIRLVNMILQTGYIIRLVNIILQTGYIIRLDNTDWLYNQVSQHVVVTCGENREKERPVSFLL